MPLDIKSVRVVEDGVVMIGRVSCGEDGAVGGFELEELGSQKRVQVRYPEGVLSVRCLRVWRRERWHIPGQR